MWLYWLPLAIAIEHIETGCTDETCASEEGPSLLQLRGKQEQRAADGSVKQHWTVHQKAADGSVKQHWTAHQEASDGSLKLPWHRHQLAADGSLKKPCEMVGPAVFFEENATTEEHEGDSEDGEEPWATEYEDFAEDSEDGHEDHEMDEDHEDEADHDAVDADTEGHDADESKDPGAEILLQTESEAG
jgi:hypothetical protein